MATIEDRIDAMLLDQAHYTTDCIDELYNDAADHMDSRDAAKAAIIADWNTAIEAMKDIIAVDIDTKHGCHYCHGCHSDLPSHSERHTPETCRIAKLQSAIASLEGLTDPRDSGTIDGEEG